MFIGRVYLVFAPSVNCYAKTPGSHGKSTNPNE